MTNNTRFALAVAASFVLGATSCSTTGGVYDKSSAENSEFSPMRTLLLAGAAVAVVAAAKNSGGGTNSYTEGGADWDQFFNERGQLVWACRDIASGQFTYESKCDGKYKTDARWPSKSR